MPLTGGTFTWAKRFLNSPRMAFAAPYLFYVGTTDNYSSFGNLGAFDTSDNTDLTSENGLSRDSTVIQGATLFTVAKVGGVEGLWQVPLTTPTARSVVLTAVDLKVTSQDSVSNLHAQGGGWLFITGSTVYRTVAAAQ